MICMNTGYGSAHKNYRRLSQISGSASRLLVVHTELQVHYPKILVSPAESGRIRPSGGIRRNPAESGGIWRIPPETGCPAVQLITSGRRAGAAASACLRAKPRCGDRCHSAAIGSSCVISAGAAARHVAESLETRASKQKTRRRRDDWTSRTDRKSVV